MPSDYIYNTQNYLEKTQKHNRKKKQYTTHTLLSLCSLSQSLLWIIKKINRCSLLSKIVALLLSLSLSPVLSLNRFSLSPIPAMAFNCFFLSPMIGKAADLCTRWGDAAAPVGACREPGTLRFGRGHRATGRRIESSVLRARAHAGAETTDNAGKRGSGGSFSWGEVAV